MWRIALDEIRGTKKETSGGSIMSLAGSTQGKVA
jgi:hypothetical protein